MPNYWIELIYESNWEIIKKRLENKKQELYCYDQNEDIKNGDVIFIYYLKKKTITNGFVGYCIAESEIFENELKIFDDKNLSKYAIKTKETNILNETVKLIKFEQLVEQHCYFKCIKTFKNKYLSKEMAFVKIPDKFGESLINHLVNMPQTKYTYDNDEEPKDTYYDSDKISESECESESESESESKSESESESETEPENIIGNIPIVFIPCCNFNNKKSFYDEFSKHIDCKKCDITNNNNFSLEIIINNNKIKEKIIEDYDEIDIYIDYYHNEKKYDNKSKYIIVYKVNNEDCDYNNCYIIII